MPKFFETPEGDLINITEIRAVFSRRCDSDQSHNSTVLVSRMFDPNRMDYVELIEVDERQISSALSSHVLNKC